MIRSVLSGLRKDRIISRLVASTQREKKVKKEALSEITDLNATRYGEIADLFWVLESTDEHR